MINWQIRSFQQLSLEAFFEVVHLRQAVFIVEQNCPYADLDSHDRQATHILGWQAHQLIAYARILPSRTKFDTISIGRVIIAEAFRGQGHGKALMKIAIKSLEQAGQTPPIKLSAQSQWQRFYESFGFLPCSDHYLEDGIEHIDMIRHQISSDSSVER